MPRRPAMLRSPRPGRSARRVEARGGEATGGRHLSAQVGPRPGWGPGPRRPRNGRTLGEAPQPSCLPLSRCGCALHGKLRMLFSDCFAVLTSIICTHFRMPPLFINAALVYSSHHLHRLIRGNKRKLHSCSWPWRGHLPKFGGVVVERPAAPGRRRGVTVLLFNSFI